MPETPAPTKMTSKCSAVFGDDRDGLRCWLIIETGSLARRELGMAGRRHAIRERPEARSVPTVD
jgi:hypothetical protein